MKAPIYPTISTKQFRGWAIRHSTSTNTTSNLDSMRLSIISFFVIALSGPSCNGQKAKIIYIDKYDHKGSLAYSYDDIEELYLTKHENDSLRNLFIRQRLNKSGINPKTRLELYYFFKYRGDLIAYVQHYFGTPRQFEKDHGQWRPIFLTGYPDFYIIYHNFSEYE